MRLLTVNAHRVALLHGSARRRCTTSRSSRTTPHLPPDAPRALQAEPGPPPPYSPAEAQGNELARVRRRPPPARELDGLVHRGSRPGVASRATHHPGRAARLLAPGDPDGVDLARRLPPAVPPDRRPHRLRHRPAWAGPRRPRPHHPMPPGRDAGGTAATTAQRRRTHAPAGGQHGPEAVWRGRVADREARHPHAPVLEEAPPRPGCQHRAD